MLGQEREILGRVGVAQGVLGHARATDERVALETPGLLKGRGRVPVGQVGEVRLILGRPPSPLVAVETETRPQTPVGLGPFLVPRLKEGPVEDVGVVGQPPAVEAVEEPVDIRPFAIRLVVVAGQGPILSGVGDLPPFRPVGEVVGAVPDRPAPDNVPVHIPKVQEPRAVGHALAVRPATPGGLGQEGLVVGGVDLVVGVVGLEEVVEVVVVPEGETVPVLVAARVATKPTPRLDIHVGLPAPGHTDVVPVTAPVEGQEQT